MRKKEGQKPKIKINQIGQNWIKSNKIEQNRGESGKIGT